MASDEWRQYLIENFNADSDVVLSLEGLTLEHIHGFLGIADKRLQQQVKDRKDVGKMCHLEMWKIDDARNFLKKARSLIGVVIGHELWIENLLNDEISPKKNGEEEVETVQ